MQRRLSAILAADMVGYSRLMAADEQATISRQKEHRAGLIDPKISEYRGRIVKTMGDGLLVEFPSAVDAVQCALEIQRAMPEREEGVEESRRIRYRVGVNLGDISIHGDDVLGDGVNVAARLEGLAKPGGICISDIVYQTLQGNLAEPFSDIGEQALKNLTRKVRVWQWAPEQTAAPFESAASPLKIPSIAVLPFANMSHEPDQEYFSDGITEDLIAAMGRFHSVAVIARNSVFRYKDQFPSARQIGEELGVRYVVEGSVRMSGERIRVSVQLTETKEGKQLWAERYDRELKEVFAVQDDVVSAIAAELGVNLTAAAHTRAQSLPPESLTAYELLLKGRSAWWRGNVNEGFKLVEEAASIDPTYAAAQAWLALNHAYQGYSATMGLDPKELGPKSRALAKRALELDDRDPFVHMAASMCFGFTQGGNKERGLRHIETAASMNPHDSEIMLLCAWHLAFFGRFDEALELTGKVAKLNPLSGAVVNECLADIHYMTGEYERCLATFEDWSEAPAQVLTVFAACHGQLGSSHDLLQRCLDDAVARGAGWFDPQRFAELQIAVCARQREADLWREGFRKAGLAV